MYQVRCFCACAMKAATLLDVADVGAFVEEWLTFHTGPACFPEVYCSPVLSEGQQRRLACGDPYHEEGQRGRKTGR